MSDLETLSGGSMVYSVLSEIGVILSIFVYQIVT